MRDIYINPTIARLAAHLDASIERLRRDAARAVPRSRRTSSYYTCGALQLAFYAAYALFGLWVLDVGYHWATAADSALEIYARSVVFAAGSFVALTAISIVAKWVLIGRFKAQSIPIWSFAYFRFWVVKTMMRTLAGDGVHRHADLQRLSAPDGRAGSAATSSSLAATARSAPTCCRSATTPSCARTSIVLGYRAQSNFIHIGPVEIGSNAFVGEASVLDIDTAMGDDTQLGHASSLQSGQRVPDGKRYHGSPAVETTSDYCPIESMECGAFRTRVLFVARARGAVPGRRAGADPRLSCSGISIRPRPARAWPPAPRRCRCSASRRRGSSARWCSALAAVYVIPRLCMLFLKAGVTYPTFGFHYLLQSIILRVSNSQFFCVLFGDSSFIVHYMRYVGWNLNKVEQTGSNMGTNQRHDNPFLCNIGSGTMVSDGLSMINTHMSATSFQLAESKIGDNNYLGNDIFYPPNGRTGANVPARHQDHDPDRRSGARECRPARLARLRDPAHGRPRPRHERVDRRGDPPRAPAPEERATTPSPRCSSC